MPRNFLITLENMNTLLIAKGEATMSVNKIVFSMMLALVIAPVSAWAQPKVTVEVKAEKEIVVVKDGKKITKRVAADEIEPGNTLIYTVRYANNGDEKATSVKVNNPVPEGTAYVSGSATGKGSSILFSIDGGKTFNTPRKLTYEERLANGKTKKRKAGPEKYTHIRWVIDEIPPGRHGALGFRVKVK